jgi:hypothetical protein
LGDRQVYKQIVKILFSNRCKTCYRSIKGGIMNSPRGVKKRFGDPSGKAMGNWHRARGKRLSDRGCSLDKGEENILMPFRGPVEHRESRCVQLGG